MLSRAAESLYWSARYMQRADAAARLLAMSNHFSMMPSKEGGYIDEWESIILTFGMMDTFEELYGADNLSRENVIHFTIFNRNNPSCVYNCIQQARNNLRAFRTSITTEVWEVINITYYECLDLMKDEKDFDLVEICDWIKLRYAALRGAFLNTQMEGKRADFFNIGCYIEKGDNTARLLSTEKHILTIQDNNHKSVVQEKINRYQWSALLRSVSSWRAFHHEYGAEYTPSNIASFLIQNPASPWSLVYCSEKLDMHLRHLFKLENESAQLKRLIEEQLSLLNDTPINSILLHGIGSFFDSFISGQATLAQAIEEEYFKGKFK